MFLKWVYFLLTPIVLALGLTLFILHLHNITSFLIFLLVPSLP